METHDLLAALGIALGLMGIVMVVTPGLVIEVAVIFVWALFESSPIGWAVLVLSVLIAGVTTYLKYQRPGRKLRETGVPQSHLWLAAGVGFIGLFVIPVIGAPLGFVATIYLLAWAKVGLSGAWDSTKASLRAIAHSTGIELLGGTVILLVWLAAALASG